MHSIVIVGTGFGAISAAIALLKRDISDFVMLERRSFAGGTWVQNSYPGAAVDVQSPLYSIAGEPYAWSHLFAKQSELADYTQNLIAKYLLSEHITLNAQVIAAKWSGIYWEVTLANNEVLTCKAIINATGPLSTPVVPEFNGFDKFKGDSFHTNDWQHGIDIANKKVAVIGSGASAVQVIPAIVDKVEKLHVIQRTPHWVIPRMDWSFPRWLSKVLSFRPLYTVIRWFIYWTLEVRVLAFKYNRTLLKVVVEWPARKHLKNQVKDEALRKKLTPDFTIGCKRIILSNMYYPALQKTNCELHDVQDRLLGFTENGLCFAVSGEVEIDVVVFATGYNASDSMVSYNVTGRDGALLNDRWRDYPRAYLGTTIPSFPNFFVITGPNTGIGHTSAIFVIESQIKYVMRCIDILQSNQVKAIEPTESAETKYTAMVHSEMEKTVWKTGGCTSWYQNKRGKVIAMFPGFSFTFRRLCQRFIFGHHNIE